MNCIKEENIQAYIDNELSIEETKKAEQHFIKCKDCNNLLQSYKKRSILLKEELSYHESIDIPDINLITNKGSSTIKRFIYAISAASILIAVLFAYNYDFNTTSSETNIAIINNFEFDANKSITNQGIEVIIVDSDGKIINNN